MNLKKLLVCFVICFVVTALSANGGLFGWKQTHGTLFHFDIGSQTVDLSSLNDEITFNFQSSYPEGFFTVGAQYFYITKDIMLGLEGKYMTNGSHKNDFYAGQSSYYSFKTSGTAGFLDLGYVLYTNRFVFIAPWVGLGMGSIDFSMASENTWQQAVEQGQPYTFSASNTATMMNWGICFDFMFRSLSLGLSAGYMHPVSEGKWQLAGEVFEEGPDTYLTGTYINFRIGYNQLNLWSNMIN